MAITTIAPCLYPEVISTPSTSGVSLSTLDAAEEHVAGVFQIPKTGTLTKIGFYLSTVSSPVLTLRAALETVDVTSLSIPVATTAAGSTLLDTPANVAYGTVDNPAAGIHWIALNSGTGVSVTGGTWVAVTVRVTAYTSGSVGIRDSIYTGISNKVLPYSYTYLGGASSASTRIPNFGLEYSTPEIVAGIGCFPAVFNTAVQFNSGSNPDRRGLRFRVPIACRMRGFYILGDFDSDTDVILYDSDEYTALKTITLDSNNRSAASNFSHYIDYGSTGVELSANTTYRLVVLPKDVTNITIHYYTTYDDGAVVAMAGLQGGVEWYYTTFNGVPTAESHVWTDTATICPLIAIIIDGFETGAGGGGLLQPNKRAHKQ